jgi:hypothetical protein
MILVADNAGYHLMHNHRLPEQKGPASLHQCVDCGAVADDWSFNHDTPVELAESSDHGRWSWSLSCYEPRCRECHRGYDA